EAARAHPPRSARSRGARRVAALHGREDEVHPQRRAEALAPPGSAAPQHTTAPQRVTTAPPAGGAPVRQLPARARVRAYGEDTTPTQPPSTPRPLATRDSPCARRRRSPVARPRAASTPPLASCPLPVTSQRAALRARSPRELASS